MRPSGRWNPVALGALLLSPYLLWLGVLTATNGAAVMVS